MYGDKSNHNKNINKFDSHVPNPHLSNSSLNIPVTPDMVKNVAKGNANFINQGPPVLPEKVTFKIFQDWQNDLFYFVERLPNYCSGMLFHKPNLSAVSTSDQNAIVDLYRLIFGYLSRAGSRNTKVRTISSNTKLYPYPDIAQWWADVDSTFKLTTKEIADMIVALDQIQQKETETCVDYLMRFLAKVTELRLAGKHLTDE
jgi:hypothetical protein